MNEYFDSFLLELNERSVVERSMLQGAEYEFEEGNILCLKLKDTIVAKGKKESLSNYLIDVFRERFQRPIEVRVLYEKPKESQLKYNNAKIQQEIEAIMEQAEAAREEKELKKKEKESSDKNQAEVVSKASGNEKNLKKKSNFDNGKRDRFSYNKRNSDDPNLIY